MLEDLNELRKEASKSAGKALHRHEEALKEAIKKRNEALQKVQEKLLENERKRQDKLLEVQEKLRSRQGKQYKKHKKRLLNFKKHRMRLKEFNNSQSEAIREHRVEAVLRTQDLQMTIMAEKRLASLRFSYCIMSQ